MHCILGLILLLPLSAKTGGELRPTPAQKQGDRSAAKPDWARDMPPASGSGYAKELERRIAKGQVVRVHTIVQTYLPVALSSLNEDFTHGYHLSGTTLKVVSPVKYVGAELLVHHPTPPSPESCWRAPGCRIEFDFNGRQLEARQAKLPVASFIFDRDLKNATLGSSVPETPVTPSVGRDAGS